MKHDLHIHTWLSSCCADKEHQRPGQILALAEEMGVETIGFADHVWTSTDPAPSGWYRPQDAGRPDILRAELAGISSKVRFLVGCEADTIAPGRFGITREFADSLDFVLLACSHFHMKEFVAQPSGNSPRELADHMLAFFRSAVGSGLATSIAHPLLPCGYMAVFDAAVEEMSDGELADAFGLARDRGVALEITVSFLPSPQERLFSIETPLRLLTLAGKAGCSFTLGSDAHSPQTQRRLPELQPLIRAAGIDEEDLLQLP